MTPLSSQQRSRTMLSKIIIVLFLFIIIGSLFSGLFYLVKDKGTSERTVRALTVRISLSVLLFVLLMIGYATGLLQPHGVTPG
jgi:F0F1-type ATP synthase membrane subunit a